MRYPFIKYYVLDNTSDYVDLDYSHEHYTEMKSYEPMGIRSSYEEWSAMMIERNKSMKASHEQCTAVIHQVAVASKAHLIEITPEIESKADFVQWVT